MKKRILSVFLCITLLAGLLTATAFAAAATEVVVAGVKLDSAHPYWKNDGSYGTEDDYNAKYDVANNVLYLAGASITGADIAAGPFGTQNTGIFAGGSINICLEDANNTIGAGKFGVVTVGDLRIYGEGILDITTGTSPEHAVYVYEGNFTLEDATVKAKTTGISVVTTGDLTVNGGTLQAESPASYAVEGNTLQFTNAQITASATKGALHPKTGMTVSGGSMTLTGTTYGAIWSEAGGVEISGNANVTANGEAYGIYAAAGNVSISGGTFNATGTGTAGILAAAGTVTLSNKVNATVAGKENAIKGTAVIVSASEVKATATSYAGIWASSDDVTISDNSDVTATGGAYGIYAATGSVNLTGGKANTSGSQYGIMSAKAAIHISGTTLTATGTTESGIYAMTELQITDYADATLTGAKYGAFAVSNFVISDSKILAQGTAGAGLCDYSSTGNMSLTNSSIQAISYATSQNTLYHGIYSAGAITITNCRVEATAKHTGNYGIYSAGGVLTLDSSWLAVSSTTYSMVAKTNIVVEDSEVLHGFGVGTHPSDSTLSCILTGGGTGSAASYTYIKPKTLYMVYTADEFSSYRQGGAGAYEAPTYSSPLAVANMVFAGWFADADDTTPITAEETAVHVYAKFVPAEVLTIKARVSSNVGTEEAEKRHIQFVTTITDLNLKEIGITGSYPRGEATKTFASKDNKTVYTELYAGEGDTIIQSPTVFSFASKFFKTYTVRNVPSSNFDTQFTATPYWVTLDGTTVVGETATKTINEGL